MLHNRRQRSASPNVAVRVSVDTQAHALSGYVLNDDCHDIVDRFSCHDIVDNWSLTTE